MSPPINDDEWDMAHESLWGPRIWPTQSKMSTSSVIVDIEHEVDYDISKFPQTNDAKKYSELVRCGQDNKSARRKYVIVVVDVEYEVDTDISKCPPVDDARCTPNSSDGHNVASQQEEYTSVVVDVKHEVASDISKYPPVDDAKKYTRFDKWAPCIKSTG